MSERDNGGPAFPRAAAANPMSQAPFNREQEGMTLRDYFASKALQGFIAGGDTNMDIAPLSYRYADAMLVARNKT